MRSAEWQRGYNSGYQAGRRGSSPQPDRSRYSERVHGRLLEVHSRRWDEMHTHFLKHGRDEEYHELRSRMIEASRAVSRYVDSTKRGRR